MRLVVQKFGGSSVATPEKLRHVASRVVATRRRGFDVVIVVSAMGEATDNLLTLATRVADDPMPRELDLLLASGEQVSSSLLAMAIQAQGEDATALTAAQSGIVTSDGHGSAEVVDVRTRRIQHELAQGRVVVVAGFQGLNPADEVATLGRGGSDTSAVALAAALDADTCQIFTDVDGVYTADPRVVPGARRIDEIDYEQMLALSRYGAKVLHADAVEHAQRHSVRIRVRSTFDAPVDGVGSDGTSVGPAEETNTPSVSAIAGRRNLLRVAGHGRDVERRVVERVQRAAVAERDFLSRSVDASTETFELLLASDNLADAQGFAGRLAADVPALDVANDLGSVSAVGYRLGSEPTRHDHVREPVRELALGGFACTQSVSCLVRDEHVEDVARTLHETFIEDDLEVAV